MDEAFFSPLFWEESYNVFVDHPFTEENMGFKQGWHSLYSPKFEYFISDCKHIGYKYEHIYRWMKSKEVALVL